MRRRTYPSDTAVAEWAVLEPLLPIPACQTRTGGRPEKWPRREIVDALRYLTFEGCKYRALPRDFPPWRTVYGFLAKWAAAGVLGTIRDDLRRRVRQGMGRTPEAVAIVIDSQSVKAAATVGKDSRGFDPGKRINGRKRHPVVDTKGLPLLVMVTPADLHDSHAAKEVLFRLRLMHPELTVVWADSQYAGKLVTWAKDRLHLTVKTVSRPKGAEGFVLLPRRWVVERSPGWIMNARRLVRDHERLPQHSEAHITWAAITLMTRRLTQPPARAFGPAPPGASAPARRAPSRSAQGTVPSPVPAAAEGRPRDALSPSGRSCLPTALR
ncbi:IS5 family transposase [Streptomyces sp. NPDC018045]|uniref:IS5 family transposase n=1 Tax=Streptomyces sp. NPDC018045 TaxID=3365037 RepID=UPI00379F1AF2